VGRKVATGAAILLVSGVIARVLGFLYRAYLSREIGPQGMGLLAMAFPIMGMALNLSSAGVPFAVAKMVAERLAVPGRRVDTVLRFAFWFVAISGLLFAAALIVGAPFFSRRFMTDPRSYLPMVASAPMVVIIPIASVMRSYFQGRQQMHPSAVATVVEQIVRILTVVYLVRYFLPYGLEWGAAGAMFGLCLGELGGLGVLLVFYRMPRLAGTAHLAERGRAAADRLRATAAEILGLGLPVTATRLVGSVTEVGDAAVVPRRLEASGLDRDAATAFYGTLSGMALPLLFFPGVITSSLAVALMPAISEANAVGGVDLVRHRAQQALRATLIVALPASAVFAAQGGALGLLIYGQSGVGRLLVPLAAAAPFLYLENTLSAVLRGLGRPALPMVNGLVGSAVRLGLIYALTAVPGAGARAVLIGISADLFLSFMLNLRSLHRLIHLTIPVWQWLRMPLLATAVMMVTLAYGQRTFASFGLPFGWSVTAALAAGFTVYGLLVYAGGDLTAWR
jgi:stage V sporulation protein B